MHIKTQSGRVGANKHAVALMISGNSLLYWIRPSFILQTFETYLSIQTPYLNVKCTWFEVHIEKTPWGLQSALYSLVY